MPRAKRSVATKSVSEPTSDDVQVDTASMGVDAGDAVVTVPPVAEEVVTQAADEQAPEAHVEKKATKEETKKVTPKAARRAKTCDKCIARREREREYARIARSKSRLLKEAKKSAAAADTPAAPATTPEAAEVEGRLNGGMD